MFHLKHLCTKDKLIEVCMILHPLLGPGYILRGILFYAGSWKQCNRHVLNTWNHRFQAHSMMLDQNQNMPLNHAFTIQSWLSFTSGLTNSGFLCKLIAMNPENFSLYIFLTLLQTYCFEHPTVPTYI